MHKFKITLVILVIFNGAVISQEKRDIGVQLGGSYYVGDYNLGKPFYQPSTALGVIFKYNINEFYTARLSATFGGLKGSYSSNQLYLPSTVDSSFNIRLLEFETMAEFNFLAFDTRQYKKQNFSPYFTVGFGFAYIDKILIHLPIGVGVKVTAGPRTAIGFEWRMHKTLTDNIDKYDAYELGIEDGSRPFLHNNDWFSFVGLFLTYRLYNYGYTCPAYR